MDAGKGAGPRALGHPSRVDHGGAALQVPDKVDEIWGEEEEVGGAGQQPVGLLVLKVHALLFVRRVEGVEAALEEKVTRQAAQPEQC